MRPRSRSRNTLTVTSRGGSVRRNRSRRAEGPRHLRNTTREDSGSKRSARAPTTSPPGDRRDPVVRRVAARPEAAGAPFGDHQNVAELPQQPQTGDAPLLQPEEVGLAREHLRECRMPSEVALAPPSARQMTQLLGAEPGGETQTQLRSP